MIEVVEDGERLLPCLAGQSQLPRRTAGVTEAGEALRFPEAVAEFPEDAKPTLVAGGGSGEVAEMTLDVAQGVPGVRVDAAVLVLSA